MENIGLSLEEKAEIWRRNPQIPNHPRTIANNQDIFLVVTGIKPASAVFLSPDNMPENIPPLLYTIYTAPFLDPLNIRYTVDLKGDSTLLYAGRTIEELNRLVTAFRYPKHPHAVGLALGYPRTAVWANKSGKSLPLETSKKIKKDAGISDDYGGFVLSQANWQEELKVFKHWHDLLDQYGFIDSEVPTTE